MTYERFEEVPVWQAAVDLARRIFVMTRNRAFTGEGDLRSQLQRAALSVSNNIAEGFERGTTQELITFLYYARGSAGEVRSMLHVIDPLDGFTHLKSQISDLKSSAESISRQLRAWADYLQNTPIKGQRYLNDAARQRHDDRARADAFLASAREQLEEFRRANEEQVND